MTFLPFEKMWDRIKIDRQDSDTTLGLSLLYFGEMVVKTVSVGLVAAIQDDRERSRYSQMYRLVRADGIGEWASTIDEILTGPTLQSLSDVVIEERSQLFERVISGWQYDAVHLMHKCIEIVEPDSEKLPTKVDARRWLSDFAKLRNATRGHGAAYSELYSKICVPLEESLKIFTENFRLFQRPWAYLYRNLSGKYRVTKLSQPANDFDDFKKSQSTQVVLNDGLYIWFDHPVKVSLMYSTVDAIDFLYPNGKFTDKKFETISYITGLKSDEDSSLYIKPSTQLPSSETQGYKNLNIQGNVFSNLPPRQTDYIQRTTLEKELKQALLNDRHPVITLVGRGGIGKTWLTLNVLYDIAVLDRFNFVLWFSARDIDLLPEGPKTVTPHVLTTPEIAQEFSNLLEPHGYKEKGFDAVKHLSETMTKSADGSILFVFDNFETVRAPIELFNWIDTFVRIPNKVLITTRYREFKGDYPIEVLGMTETESEELIQTTSVNLGISHLLTENYKAELYQESNGHPYVMKVLLGEVAKAGKTVRVERIVAARDDILDALFERTFSGLSPVARRVFLTVCRWRSSIPLLALEAVLLRPTNELMDVENAVEELGRSSFVELTTSTEDNELFVTVPLAASVFGKKKLSTYAMKSAVESDVEILHAFGASQQSDINKGVSPRIDKLYKFIAERISSSQTTLLEDSLPVLEFVARKFPRAWLLLAKLYQEIDSQNAEKPKECIRRYIETSPKDKNELSLAWRDLAQLCSHTEDWTGEIQALVEMCQLPSISFYEISNSVNRVNSLFNRQFYVLDSEEKRAISQKLAEVMEDRIFKEGDATDCSRLAWLLIRLKNENKANQIIDHGLSIEPDNEYCMKLLNR